ncbi:hypothetical protein [Williamsia sp. CHRR-6]|uniref:hypothetical protein n=1 Tax=Williamsia sp. CHRR-6 TaxID=2835871 RepID=UPI001BD92C4C|nr:hypothetical protein [Williamsia sp. CHRR-6]MBT0566288.1 hypothetical protein [Williamsia sp. CHRR-6]
MSFVLNALDRVRRRWYVVAAVLAVFVVGAGISTLGQSSTYSAKSALSASSVASENSPYALSLAYIYLFNDPSFQGNLFRTARVPAGVSAMATPATVGSIFYITATADTGATAISASSALATAFRTQINAALSAARQDTIDNVTAPMADRIAKQLDVPPEERVALQDQINVINSNTNGTLNAVGLESNATENAPQTTNTYGIALVGGLLAGLAGAFGLDLISRRLRAAYDVTAKTSFEESVGIGDADVDDGALRRADLRHLANRLTNGVDPAPRVIAVVPAQPGARGGAAEVALALVDALGTPMSPATLVRTDTHFRVTSEAAGATGAWGPGFVDLLADPNCDLALLARVRGPGVRVIEPGDPLIDPASVVIRQSVRRFLTAALDSSEWVVLHAPLLTESPEGQVICAQADITVTVVDPITATVDEVQTTRRLLAEVKAPIGLAVVIAAPDVALEAAPTRRYGPIGPPTSTEVQPHAAAPIAQTGHLHQQYAGHDRTQAEYTQAEYTQAEYAQNEYAQGGFVPDDHIHEAHIHEGPIHEAHIHEGPIHEAHIHEGSIHEAHIHGAQPESPLTNGFLPPEQPVEPVEPVEPLEPLVDPFPPVQELPREAASARPVEPAGPAPWSLVGQTGDRR